MNLIQIFHPTLIWCIIGIIMLIIEFMMPGFIVFFFSMGAFVIAIIYYFTGININLQLILFLVISIILLFTLRSKIKAIFKGIRNDTNNSTANIDTFVGETAIVIEEINPPYDGKIEFHGTEWSANSSCKIEPKSKVKIIKQTNLTFTVEKI